MRDMRTFHWIISISIVLMLALLGWILFYGFPTKNDSPFALVTSSGIYDSHGTRIAIPKPLDGVDADLSGPRIFRITSGMALVYGDRIEIYGSASHRLKRTIPAGPNADFYSVRAVLEEEGSLILISLEDGKPSSQVINQRGAAAFYKDYLVLSVDSSGTPIASVKHKSSLAGFKFPDFFDNVTPVYSRDRAVLILRSGDSNLLLTYKTGETSVKNLDLDVAYYPTCLEGKVLLKQSKAVFLDSYIYTFEIYNIWSEKKEFITKIDHPKGEIYSLIDKSEIPESAFQPTPK